MQRLSEIIGPAPFEMPIEEMTNKVRAEHSRATEAIARFMAQAPKAAKKSASPSVKQKAAEFDAILALAKSKGIDLSKLMSQ